jgi:hypothetical protein
LSQSLSGHLFLVKAVAGNSARLDKPDLFGQQ